MNFKFTIQKKLLLASMSLLVIPWIGYQYIQEMQSYLHKNMESELQSKVKLIAASLHERPALFNNQQSISISNSANPITTNNHLYVRPITPRIKLDGYIDDWSTSKQNISYYDKSNDLLKNPNSDLSFSMQLGSKKHSLYALFQVVDDKVIYRKENSLSLTRSDHLIISLINKQNEHIRYIITAKKSGWVTAFKINNDNSSSPEIRIKGNWLKTKNGYNLEIRIPTYILNDRISFAFADIDNNDSRKIKSIIATSNINEASQLGTIIVPSPEVEQLLSRIKQHNTRIWVVNKAFHVVALSDQLLSSENNEIQPPQSSSLPSKQSFFSGLMRLIYQQFLTQPTTNFVDDLSTTSQLNTNEVISALQGTASFAWRTSSDGRVSILTATYPIYTLGQVVGAVAVEETSNNILLLQNQAIEILINLSILTFLVAFIVLIIIAIRFSSRIRTLRDEADHAISADGKVIAAITTSTSQDEIGDLSRSTANMLQRLHQYHRYLEGMASKLAHELRTPITVVRSSIENMENANPDDKATYLKRASSGIKRLNNILTRMSEASRLEQTLQTEEIENFNLSSLVKSCIDGYQQSNPNQVYSAQIEDAIHFSGSPDLIAQLLDKLISNANDYAKNNTDIIIVLRASDKSISLKVMNQGEPLQDEMMNHLFDSMVSLRKLKTEEPHLGLGLYIVKLISDFHHGNVKAYNTDSHWVCFEIIFPISN